MTDSPSPLTIAVAGVPGNWSSEKLADAVAARTGHRLLVDVERIRLDLQSGDAMVDGVNLRELDGLIIKKIGLQYSPGMMDRLEMLRFLNERGLRMFSKPRSILRLLDRLSCTISLRAAGVPMPPTTITEDKAHARGAVRDYGRAVFKPLFTTKARGMAVIADGPDAAAAIDAFVQAGNPVMYVQKMVDIPGKDLGVTFLGGAYLATYARASRGGAWNTTTNSGGRYVPHEPSPEVVELAHQAQALFDMDFTCVDIVETPEGPLVFEVSAFGGFRGLLEANHIDAAALYAGYALEKISHG